MKTLKRNQRPFYYCLYKSEAPIVDEDGFETGETIVCYHDPVKMYANISQATGQSNTEVFGNLENYDKVIVYDDLNCPIDENSVLFIDKDPEYTDVPTHRVTESTALYGVDTVDLEPVTVPVPDYVVIRVSKSLNSVSVAVRKVELS